jgi:hypothetical protein
MKDVPRILVGTRKLMEEAISVPEKCRFTLKEFENQGKTSCLDIN